jgi:hypothetical protein
MAKTQKLLLPSWGQTLLFIGISLGILGVLAWRVDMRETFGVLFQMRKAPLVLAVIIAVGVGHLLGGYKWMRILAGLGRNVPYRHILLARLGGEPVKFIFPAKSGELIRPIYLRTRFQIPLPIGIGSLALDKVYNLAGLLLVMAIGLMLRMSLSAALVVLVFALFSLFLVHHIARPASNWLAGKPGRIPQAGSELLSTLHALPYAESAIQLLLGAAFLFAEIITGLLVLSAAGVDVPFVFAMVRLPLVILLVQVPVTISGIGTREAGMVALFGAFASPETLFAVGIAFTLVEVIAPVAVGLPFLPSFLKRIDWRALGKALNAEEDAASNAD